MRRNIEIKARVEKPAELRARVVFLSRTAPKLLIQEDTFYKVAAGRLKLRDFTGGTGELIYYDRPNQPGPKQSTYTITPVSDVASMKELLGRFLEVRNVVAKRRELFLIGQTRVHLDEVENLGSFLELEVVLEQDQSEAEGTRIALGLMAQLGVREENLVDQAYVDLLELKIQRQQHTTASRLSSQRQPTAPLEP